MEIPAIVENGIRKLNEARTQNKIDKLIFFTGVSPAYYFGEMG
jgi:hypothetical protein